MRSLIVLSALLVLLPVTGTAAGDGGQRGGCDVATVTGVHFDVQIVRDGKAQAPIVDDTVCLRDRITTGSKGVAMLRFSDGTQITVGHDSEFVIQRWKQRKMLANDAAFELVRGAFRAVTGTITKRSHRFKVKTAIATIGVRGTDFWGGTTISDNALDVIMLEGRGVYVENDAGRVELETAGIGTTVRAGRSPDAPKTWSPEKLQKAVATVTP